MVTTIATRGLVKDYGAFRAVAGLDLTIGSGEFVALLGPSGSGKTTVLRCLAGLEDPDDGEVIIGEDVVAAPRRGILVPPDRRRVGLVFQNYALWPHMSVLDTVGYPMKISRVPRAERRRRALELLSLVGMVDFAERRCAQLSGGQQQRVALARALANGAGVMLYDEPLSNLDARLRVDTRAAIRDLHLREGSTSLYVTHDQEEALALADRIVVMNRGLVEQDADPVTIYRRPASVFVARFLGVENLLDGVVVGLDRDRVVVELPGGGRIVAGRADGAPLAEGDRATVGFRASDVRAEAGPGAGGAVTGQVREVEYAGDSWSCRVAVGQDSDSWSYIARVRAPRGGATPRVGDRMCMGVPDGDAMAFPAGSRAPLEPAVVAAAIGRAGGRSHHR